MMMNEEARRTARNAIEDLVHDMIVRVDTLSTRLDDCPMCGSQIGIPPKQIFSCDGCGCELEQRLHISERELEESARLGND